MKQIFPAIAMLALSMPVHADTIFNATGTGTSGTTLTGKVDIDATTGSMEYAQFDLSNGVTMYGTGGSVDGTEYTVPLVGSDGNPWILNINLNGSSTLVGYSGGSFVTAYPHDDSYFEIVGNLSPSNPVNSSPVPEPSTLALLGTGLLFFGSEIKRRFRDPVFSQES